MISEGGSNLNMLNMSRNSNTSRFKKIVGVSEGHYDFLIKTKYKKSIAGRLEEIINYYLENYESRKKTN